MSAATCDILPQAAEHTQPAHHACFGANIQTFSVSLYECGVIGAEEPFIAHSAEQCPSI